MNCHYRSGNRNKHYIRHNVSGVNSSTPGVNRLLVAAEPEAAVALMAALVALVMVVVGALPDCIKMYV